MKFGKNAAHSGAKRSLVLVVSVLVLLLAVAGGTLAWLTAQDSVNNTFTPAHVTCTVEETFNGTEKTNVQIKNTSDIPAYIRAYIVVTWKDADGNVYGKLPVANTDYTMTMGPNGWAQKDGYWYCNTAVASGANTPVLISNCEVKDNATIPDGYKLSVEIIAEAIQSVPDTAVKEAWGVVPSTLANQSGN